MRPAGLLLLLAVVGGAGPTAAQPPSPAPVAEAAPAFPLAPPFALADLEDPTRTHSLDAFAGRYVLVDFWASWCAPCIAEVPNLAAVHQAFAADGFEVLSISLDLSADRVAGFRERIHPMPWAHAFADGQFENPVVLAFGVDRVPQAFLIGPEGHIVAGSRRLRDGRLWQTLNETLGTDRWPDE